MPLMRRGFPPRGGAPSRNRRYVGPRACFRARAQGGAAGIRHPRAPSRNHPSGRCAGRKQRHAVDRACIFASARRNRRKRRCVAQPSRRGMSARSHAAPPVRKKGICSYGVVWAGIKRVGARRAMRAHREAPKVSTLVDRRCGEGVFDKTPAVHLRGDRHQQIGEQQGTGIG